MKNSHFCHLRTIVCVALGLISAAATPLRAAPTPTAAFTTVQSFSQVLDGVQPVSPLVLGADGNYYGVSTRGGRADDGVVFQTTPSGTTTIFFDFANDDTGGTHPRAGLCIAGDGNFYGTTSQGGANGDGTLFQLTTAGVETTFHSFVGSSDGSTPVGTLVRGATSGLFGVCSSGGSSSSGTVFELTTGGGFVVLHAFGGFVGNNNVNDGKFPNSGLCLGSSDGNFYGVTGEGGAGTSGAVYSITSTGTYTLLHSFDLTTGGFPDGALVELSGTPGTFMGVTALGGANKEGVVYQISSTMQFNDVYDFSLDQGAIGEPFGQLTRGSEGLYYGFGAEGGANDSGGIYAISPLGGVTSVRASFGRLDGETPLETTAGLTAANGGNLFFGVTELFGASNQGLIFTLANEGGAFTVLHDFFQGGNATSKAGLVRDSAGFLYGTTAAGGASNLGTVFELTPGGVFATLYNFAGPDASTPEGATPSNGPLVLDSDGDLFGTTSAGGTNNMGTAYKLDNGELTTLHSFGNINSQGILADGSAPEAGLTLSNGNFFGVAPNGGENNDGVFFQLTPAGMFTSLQFLLPAEGSSANDSLVLGGDSNFYGTAFGGGANGTGAVYSFSQSGAETPVYSFSALDNNRHNSDGAFPSASLLEGASRLFFGTAQGGGANGNGTIFTVTPEGGFNPLYSFSALVNGSNADGAAPQGLVKGSDGNFYGCTVVGGANQNGTLFVITPDGTLTVLHTFATVSGGVNAEGAGPVAPLLETTPGTFYGTAQSGGAGQVGTIFSLTVSPAITSTAAAGFVGQLFSFQITATNGPTSFAADSLPSFLTLDTTTGVLSGTPPATGSFVFKIGAQNAGGFDDEFLVLNVAKPMAPKINSPLTAAATVGQAFSYQITATNLPTSYAADALPMGLTVDTTTGRISGKPTMAGTFAFMIGAQNASGSDDETLTLTVSAAVLAPKITSPLTASGQVGVAFTYQITANNFPTSYAADALPPGVTVNTMTGSISGTPTVSGIYAVEVGAQNATGADDEMLTLTIAAALERGPKITSALAVSGQAGVAFTYKIKAGNSPTHFGADGLPAGLSVDAKTGVISGVTTLSGVFPVILKATNAARPTVTATLTLTVDATVTLGVKVHLVKAGSGPAASFQLTRVGDLSQPLTITFALKGTAVNGTDYMIPSVKHTPMGIMGTRKFAAGQASRRINVVPIDEKLRPGTIKVVKFVLEPGTGYVVAGDAAMIVKIAYGD
jgi:uncharacterized repeat protein (TIGR03803 family)